MKKVLLTIAVLVCAATAFAQKPVRGDMGFGMRFSAFNATAINAANFNAVINSSELLYRYYLTDKIVVRAGFGINNVNNSGTYKKDSTYFFSSSIPAQDGKTVNQNNSSTYSTKSSGFSISPGVEYHFAGGSKLDPYAGIQVFLSSKGTTTVESTATTVDIYALNGKTIYESKEITKTVTPGGLSFGVGAVTGFQYFFSEKFAVGAEYLLAFQNIRTGGTVTNSFNGTFTTLVNADDVTSQTVIGQLKQSTEYTQTTSDGSLSLRATAGIYLNYFF